MLPIEGFYNVSSRLSDEKFFLPAKALRLHFRFRMTNLLEKSTLNAEFVIWEGKIFEKRVSKAYRWDY